MKLSVDPRWKVRRYKIYNTPFKILSGATKSANQHLAIVIAEVTLCAGTFGNWVILAS